jgi:hypothetical protein
MNNKFLEPRTGAPFAASERGGARRAEGLPVTKNVIYRLKKSDRCRYI